LLFVEIESLQPTVNEITNKTKKNILFIMITIFLKY